MYYKRPSDVPGRSIGGARWSNYGNPGRRFGGASLSYLLWNLPRTRAGVLPGGGIVRGRPRARPATRAVRRAGGSSCRRSTQGRRNGLVGFAYAKVDGGGQAKVDGGGPAKVGGGRQANVDGGGQEIYGWVMRGYRLAGHGFTGTLR